MGRAIGSDDASAERMYSLIHGYAYVLNAKPIGEGKSVNTPNTIAHIRITLVCGQISIAFSAFR